MTASARQVVTFTKKIIAAYSSNLFPNQGHGRYISQHFPGCSQLELNTAGSSQGKQDMEASSGNKEVIGYWDSLRSSRTTQYRG